MTAPFEPPTDLLSSLGPYFAGPSGFFRLHPPSSDFPADIRVTQHRIADADGVSTPAFISKLHSEVLQTQGEPVNFTSLLRTACLIFEAQNDPQTHHDDVLPVAAE